MVFFGLTGMIPPDRTMFKSPQVNRDTSSGQQLSSMERFIRYAEKDDWLLYITALFGILMPGIMYFFYKKAHNAYLQYSKTRSSQKKQEKQRKKMIPKKLEMTIFYCGEGTKAKKLAYEAAEKLEDIDPLVVKFAETDFSAFQYYQGLCLFIINIGEDLKTPPECSSFFDFLSETKFERKQRALLQHVMFSVFAFIPNKEHVESALKLVTEFRNRLPDVGGHEVCDSVFCYDEQVKEYFDVWMTETRYTTKRMGVGKPTVTRRRPIPETSESDTEASYISSEENTDHEKFD